MSEPLLTKPIFPFTRRITWVFAWYDFWIGVYWNREKRWLYVLPVPMVGIRIDFSQPGGEGGESNLARPGVRALEG